MKRGGNLFGCLTGNLFGCLKTPSKQTKKLKPLISAINLKGGLYINIWPGKLKSLTCSGVENHGVSRGVRTACGSSWKCPARCWGHGRAVGLAGWTCSLTPQVWLSCLVAGGFEVPKKVSSDRGVPPLFISDFWAGRLGSLAARPWPSCGANRLGLLPGSMATWPSWGADRLGLLPGQEEEKELAWPLRALWLLERKLGP